MDSFDLAGAVVTVDAMHTQTDTARLIVEASGDYVFTIKGNQPTLYAACKALPWREVPARRVSTTGRGRRVNRTIKVVTAPGLGHLPRRRAGRAATAYRHQGWEEDRRGRLPDHPRRRRRGDTGDARGVGARTLGHREPAALGPGRDLRRRPLPSPHRRRTQVMATLRNTVISLLRLAGWTNIAQALRHHAADQRRPLALLMTP